VSIDNLFACSWDVHELNKQEGSVLQWIEQSDGRVGVTQETLHKVLWNLKVDANMKFPGADVLHLLKAAKKHVLVSKVAVQKIDLPHGPDGVGRIIVVGDTHGQLADVMWIFFKHGIPRSTSNVYLFNGDVVDRGNRALEILMVMIIAGLADPGSVYMNRGNHEEPFLSSIYGFRDECLTKYGWKDGHQIYDLSQELFNNLPIASTIQAGEGKNLLVVHGGLPRAAKSLDDIAKVNFAREVPTPTGAEEDTIFFDCLWSDPQITDGFGPNSRGPNVVSFGPDISEAFLKNSGLDMLIRSHAVPSDGAGFEWHHCGRVLTVFSASNYVGRSGNLGAVVIVRQDEPLETHEHWAASIEELVKLEEQVHNASDKLRAQAVQLAEARRKRYSMAEGLEKMQLQTLEHIKEGIVTHKAELFEFWTTQDSSADFHVELSVWKDGMSKFFGDQIPWDWVKEKLAITDPDTGLVPYTRFLQRFRVAQVDKTVEQNKVICSDGFGSGWQRALLYRVFESLLRADLPLRGALSAIDRNADGTVSAVELCSIVADCGVMLSASQCRALLRTFTTHRSSKAGRLQLFDFLESITVTFAATRRQPAVGAAEWVPRALDGVAKAILADALSMSSANSTNMQPAASAAAAGVSTNGCNLLTEKDIDDKEPHAEIESLRSTSTLQRTSVAELLATWFRAADADGNGYLSRGELEGALERCSHELDRQGVPSDANSRMAIADYMDCDKNGRVNYLELLATLMPYEKPRLNGAVHPLTEDLVEAVSVAIYANKATLITALREQFDPERKGLVSQAEFIQVVSALGQIAPSQGADGTLLPRVQIEALASELACFSSGQVEYETFINSFRILDSLEWTGPPQCSAVNS